MGLRKVDKVYWLDIRIKGKRIRRSLYTSNRLKALDEYGKKKEELLAEYGQKRVGFLPFCEQYLKWAWSSKPASALREQQRLSIIQGFFHRLEISYLSDITPYHIEQLKIWLKEKNLSKSTINRYLQILRGLFYRAIDWEVHKGANPLKKVRFFKESPRIRPLRPQELRSVLKVAKGISKKPKSPLQKNFYNLCLLAINTGMRKSEILNLKWKYVSLTENNAEAIIIGKGNIQRIVPLNAIACTVIAKNVKKNEYVFDIPNRNRHSLFCNITNRIKKEIGIDWHFHLFRHYFTTKLVEKSVDFVTIGSILGHSKITMSLIYSHTNGEKKKKAVELLDTFEDI